MSQKSIKVLGIQFDDTLSWSDHVCNAVTKTNRMLHGLRRIRRHLSTKHATQVMTSFYFSILYYGAEVWLHRHLSFHLKQKIRSAHYRAMRVVHGNLSRDELDIVGTRANPDEWADYSLSKLLARMIITGQPKRLMKSTMVNSFSERRQPNRLFFYDDSAKKIGRQVL